MSTILLAIAVGYSDRGEPFWVTLNFRSAHAGEHDGPPEQQPVSSLITGPLAWV